MGSKWRPGDVATDDGGHRWFAVGTKGLGTYWYGETGNAVRSDWPSLRPLVVLDPEDAETARRLASLYDSKAAGPSAGQDMQAVLRSLALPPKPDEPSGLGAVIEDVDGRWWSRLGGNTDFPWHHGTQGRARYDEIKVVKVLSEGVAS